jgi:hypothetical protein
MTLEDRIKTGACIADNCDEPRLLNNWRCLCHDEEWMMKRNESIREHVKRHNLKGYEAKYYIEEDQ